jgi:putative hemolysin
MNIAFGIVLLFLLIFANGVLALAEMAIVSARKVRLQQRAEEGSARARAALDLAEDPSRFLSAVQIGITLIGILAGAFGGASLAEKLAAPIATVVWLAPYAEAISVTVIVIFTTYLSLVLGELVPKRLALTNPERVATAMAPFMRLMLKLTSPFARLLTWSTDLVLRILGIRPSAEPPVTQEEVQQMIEQGTQVGVFEQSEQEMVERVLRLDDRVVSALMTPRPEVDWLDTDDAPDQIIGTIVASAFSVFPVAHGDLDNILGLVRAKDLLSRSLACQPLDLRAVLQPALSVPENISGLELLERFRETHAEIALVIDEYGSFRGVVTLDDVLEAIVGDIPTAAEAAQPEAVQREDGSWLMDGSLSIDEFMQILQVERMPDGEEGHYQTLGGFVMAFLGRIPTAGDHFEWGGLRLEVMDMDSLRVDKVLVKPVESPPTSVDAEPLRD